MNGLLRMVIVLALAAGGVAAQSETTLTYQGSLQQSGVPANGAYDLQFSLWDALAGGNRIGSAVQLADIPVSDGLFTVQLDFGVAPFDGTPLWLEVSVDRTALAPRQPVTSVPWSIQTRGIFVDADHDVGIGTSNPLAPLEVHNRNSGEMLRLESDRTYGYLRFREGSADRALVGFGDDGGLLAGALPDSFAIDGLSAPLHFATGSDANKGITVDANGNVSIGTTAAHSDVTTLTVINSFSSTTVSPTGIWAEGEHWGGVFRASDNDGEGVYGYASGENGRGVRGICGGAWGNGVEGITTGSNGAGVSGYTHAGPDSVAVRGYGFNTWDFFAAGPGGHYGEVSSIRWKTNIQPIDDPLEKVSRLRGVTFDWKADWGGLHDIGMIAEEVGQVLPEIVSYEKNGVDASGMDYTKLSPLLIEAVKELTQRLEAREQEMAALRAAQEAEVAALSERVRLLERMIEQMAPARESAGASNADK